MAAMLLAELKKCWILQRAPLLILSKSDEATMEEFHGTVISGAEGRAKGAEDAGTFWTDQGPDEHCAGSVEPLPLRFGPHRFGQQSHAHDPTSTRVT